MIKIMNPFYKYDGFLHYICCYCANWEFLGTILSLSYVHMFVALFQMIGMNWSVMLGTFVGACMRKQCRSMQFSLKRARLA